MFKSLKSLALAAVIACMALASTAAQAISNTVDSAKRGAVAVALAVAEKVDTFGFELQVRLGLIATLVTFTDPYTGKYPVLVQPDDSDADEVAIPFTWPLVAPALNDILALIKIPLNIKILDWKIISESADSNGAPTLAYSLGSLNSFSAPTALTTTYGAAIAASQGTNGGIARATSRAAFIESTAADRAIGLLVTAVAATYVPGAKAMLVLQLSDA